MSSTDVRGGSGAMFDGIAARYDLMNRLLSLGIDQGWRKKAVRELGARPRRVVDLATGTGDLAIAIAETHPEALVVGVDPSRGMLDVAAKKLTSRHLDRRVELVVGEAEQIPLEDASVDGVTIAFGIRNVADRPRALREMRRVTKPGGKVVILELTEPRSGPMGRLARLHIHSVVPALGALLSGRREYRYLETSIAAFPAPERFGEMMVDSGLKLSSVIRLSFGAAHIFVGETPAAS
jgi:demethylmenaquinone methyltransferase/2-methoxy-6-polyprenyl-1,4-benzoquinol methylase